MERSENIDCDGGIERKRSIDFDGGMERNESRLIDREAWWREEK